MAENVPKQVKITCPVCSQHLDVTELPAFEVVACVKCGEKLLVPMQLGNFRLLSTIGGGGMGTVYKAVDMSLGRQVAVKLLRKDLAKDKHFIETFTREARAVAALSHPNIATLYSFGVENDQYYLVMELVPRGSLDDTITNRKRIPEAEALDIAIQVGSGLRHAYQRGLIHRDIKPGNILFSETGVPKIVDFGLAEFHTDRDLKKPKQEGIWGTPYYIAPEKIAGEKEDFRSDIYSLGGTLFHALAGRAPFEANTATDVVLKHLSTPALSLKTFAPDISDDTARTVGRMLAKNRAARYSSYDALVKDLQLAKHNLTTHGVRRVSEDVKVKAQKSAMQAVILVAAVVIGIAVGAVVLGKQLYQFFKQQKENEVQTILPIPTTTGTGTGTVTTTVPPDASTASWRIPWRNAISSLDQGNYAAAANQYKDALKKQEATDPLRPWSQTQLGVCYLLAYQTNEALAAYSALIPTNGPAPSIGGQIDPDKLPALIALVMTDRASANSLLTKLSDMPDWGQALVRFHIAARCLARDEFTLAQKLFNDYGSMATSSDPLMSWATTFQIRANTLGLECEAFNKDFPAVLDSQKQGDYDSALAKLQTIRSSVSYPTLVAKLQTVDASLKKELAVIAEEKRKAEEARLGAILQSDMRLLAKIDANAPAYAANYLFDPLAKAYKDSIEKMQTDKGKEEAIQRQKKYQGLAELKTSVIALIAKKPYAGGAIVTRNGAEVKGSLYRADEEKLYFKLPYGDIPMKWTNLAPAQVAKILQFYLKNVTDEEKKTSLAAALNAFREELKVN